MKIYKYMKENSRMFLSALDILLGDIGKPKYRKVFEKMNRGKKHSLDVREKIAKSFRER